MKKAIVAAILSSTILCSAGCSALTPSQEIAQTTSAFTQEEIKANRTGVILANQENIVYQYVSNSIQINKDKLIAVDTADAKLIKDKVAEINEALRTGKTVITAKELLKQGGGTTSKTSEPTSESSAEASKGGASTEASTEGSKTTGTAAPTETSSTQTSEAQVAKKEATAETAEVNQVSDKVIVSESIANYMLHQFSKTPYTWEMTDCKIVGMDSATHLYFVDVYYHTTQEKKSVLPDTVLVRGMPDYDAYAYQRYLSYVDVLNAKIDNDTEAYTRRLKAFEERWGKIDEIAESLEFDSPLKYARKYGSKYRGLGSYAYAGTKNTYTVTGASVVYRMVMGYNYSINNETIIEPKAVYEYNYNTDNYDAIVNPLKSEQIDAKEIISPLVNRLIYRYEKAMDETDHNGLYGMYKSYKKYDTEVYMYDLYAYHKLGSYVYDLIGRKDDKVYVLVTFNNKERTKGSAMSEANYKDEKLFTLSIDKDDNLKLIDVLDLKRDIVGEPLSVISKVNGVQDQINYSEAAFTESNKKAVEATIKEFMKLELTQSFGSDVFKTCIDLGINASELESMKKTLSAISANDITTWITGYNMKSNLYVNLSLREIYVNTEKHTAYETTSNIGLINRSGKWFVVSYARTMSVRLQSNRYSDIDALEHYRLKDNKIVSVQKEVATIAESNVEE